MATLVNKLNREVKVIIPNMREFSTFYSDNEGVIGMFFKRDWVAIKEDGHCLHCCFSMPDISEQSVSDEELVAITKRAFETFLDTAKIALK